MKASYEVRIKDQAIENKKLLAEVKKQQSELEASKVEIQVLKSKATRSSSAGHHEPNKENSLELMIKKLKAENKELNDNTNKLIEDHARQVKKLQSENNALILKMNLKVKKPSIEFINDLFHDKFDSCGNKENGVVNMKHFRNKLLIPIKECKQAYSVELKESIQELGKIYNNDLKALYDKVIKYWSNNKLEVDQLKANYEKMLLESKEQIKVLEEENAKYKLQIAKGLEEHLLNIKSQEECNKLIHELKLEKYKEDNKKVRELLIEYSSKDFKSALNDSLRMCNKKVEKIMCKVYRLFKDKRSRQVEFKFSCSQSYTQSENKRKQEFLAELNRLRKANVALKREVESSIAEVKKFQNIQSESDGTITELKGQNKKWMQNLKTCIQEFRKAQTELERLKAERTIHLNQIRELKERHSNMI
jgi:hypothetical protein